MRLSASRIRSINFSLSGGRPFYNEHKPLALQIPNTSYSHVVFVPATRP